MLIPSGDNPSPLQQLLMAEKAAEERGFSTPVQLQEYRDNICPECFIDYYGKFLSLSRRRGESMGGLSPLSWQDIDSWCRIHEHTPSTLFLDVVELLDSIWLRVYRKKNKPKK